MFKWLLLLASFGLCIYFFVADFGTAGGLIRSVIWMGINIFIGFCMLPNLFDTALARASGTYSREYISSRREEDLPKEFRRGEVYACVACGATSRASIGWSIVYEEVYCECGHREPLPKRERYATYYRNL